MGHDYFSISWNMEFELVYINLKFTLIVKMLEFRVVQNKMSLLLRPSRYCYDLGLYHHNSSDIKDLRHKRIQE